MKHSRRFKKTCNPSRLSFQTYVDYCIVKRKPAITTTVHRLNPICLTDLNQYHKCQRMPGTRFIPLGPMSGKALLSSITKGSWPRSNRVGQRKEKTGHKRNGKFRVRDVLLQARGKIKEAGVDLNPIDDLLIGRFDRLVDV